MKKVLLYVVILLLLASCTKQSDTSIDVEEPVLEPVVEPIEEDEDLAKPLRYTGEIITDGFFGSKGRIYFIPDKETRELLKNEYPYPIDAGGSIPLDYDGIDIVKDLPDELGIYKVEVEANFNAGGIISILKSIRLTEEIGTIEYEGKEYPTNELDETVTAKDRVCGLIVSNVKKVGDGGVLIYFEGEIESEGFYNVYPGGEFYNNIRLGRITPDGESVKNFPSYKGVGLHNNFSVFFPETNELFRRLTEHSAIGRGKFKSIGYNIIYNYGGGAPPREVLTEIISLNEKYKGLFPYDDNKIIGPLSNEDLKYKAGFMDNFAIVVEIDNYEKEDSTSSYYFLGYEDVSKIKINTIDEFSYGLEENKNENSIELSSSQGPHSISIRYFDKNSSSTGKDSLLLNYSYAYFNNGTEVVRIFEGDSILGMTAEDINVEYISTQDSLDELVRVMCKFTGEVTLTGKLTMYYDEGYGYNKLHFAVDEDSIKKLPIHIDDLQKQGFISFDYESVKELIGTEPFEKSCEIKINNYNISKSSYTSSVDTAELISVTFFE